MNDVWQEFTVVVASIDVPLLESILVEKVAGHDAIYSSAEHLSVVFPTEVDEVMFRLALLGDTTIDDIHPIGGQDYVVAARLAAEIAEFMALGTFEAAVAPITVGHLELRGKAVFDRIEADLTAGQAPFVLMPALWPA